MTPHGSVENGPNWDDGNIPHYQLKTALSKAVAGYAHLYGYGVEKCQFLSKLIGRPVLNLEDFKCPLPHDLKPGCNCIHACYKRLSVSCATRNATSYYEWLKYHFQTKSYVKCPKDKTRHTSMFVQRYKSGYRSPTTQST